jgi:hypothetical protein
LAARLASGLIAAPTARLATGVAGELTAAGAAARPLLAATFCWGRGA